MSDEPDDPEFVRMAVGFYVRLPPSERRSLRAMATLGAESDIDAAIHAVGIALVRRGLDVGRHRGRAAAANIEADETDVETLAFRLQREAEGRGPR